MSEYDKSRLYWIKLTDRFFDSDAVDFLMTKKNGANYVVLYQMLCLKTVNNGGVLARTLGEVIIPYDVEKIQRDCKWFSSDTVRVALDFYKKLGLIYENRDGIFAISEFDRLIGSQSVGAEKKAIQRRNREQEPTLEGGRMSAKCPPICPPEKEKEKEKENIYPLSSREEKNIFDTSSEESEEKNCVFLTKEEKQKLLFLLSESDFEHYVKVICECESSGKRYGKSHFQAILDMATADGRIKDGKTAIVVKTASEKKQRYGTFDANEAFANALKRTYENGEQQ